LGQITRNLRQDRLCGKRNSKHASKNARHYVLLSRQAALSDC